MKSISSYHSTTTTSVDRVRCVYVGGDLRPRRRRSRSLLKTSIFQRMKENFFNVVYYVATILLFLVNIYVVQVKRQHGNIRYSPVWERRIKHSL